MVFIVLTTPAAIVQKTQNLDTNGDISGEMNSTQNIIFANAKGVRGKDTGANVRYGWRIDSSDNQIFGDGAVAGDCIIRKDDGAVHFKFQKGTTDITLIDNSGHISTDGGSTFVDVTNIPTDEFMYMKKVALTSNWLGTWGSLTEVTSDTITPIAATDLIVAVFCRVLYPTSSYAQERLQILVGGITAHDESYTMSSPDNSFVRIGDDDFGYEAPAASYTVSFKVCTDGVHSFGFNSGTYVVVLFAQIGA